jgi:hypothetical protein
MFIILTEVYNLRNCYPEFPNKWIGDTKEIKINIDNVIILTPIVLKPGEEHIANTIITYNEEGTDRNTKGGYIIVKETGAEIQELISTALAYNRMYKPYS